MESDKMPSDQDYESYVLGAIFNEKYAQDEGLSLLGPEEFYYHQHRLIFEAFKEINRQGRRINILGASKSLKEADTLDQVGGVSYLQQLADNGVLDDFDFYVTQLLEFSSKRKMIQIGQSMMNKARDHKSSSKELIEKFSGQITGIGSHSKDGFVDMADIVSNYKDGKDFLTVVKEEMDLVAQGHDLFDGVRTHYEKLDNLIGGFPNGTNNIIGARSSSGKTTFLTNLFQNISENSPEVRMGFFSLEMKKSRIMEKIACSLAGVSFQKLMERTLNTEEYERLMSSGDKVKSMNLCIFDKSGIKISDLKSQTRRESINGGLDIVFLDYLSIVQSDNNFSNKHQAIDQVSKGLQSVALELNIPMVTLSQLNRNIYSRTDKVPVLADLRESGSIEEDADLVMLLHRPIHYALASDGPMEDITQLIVAKSRLMGDLGKVEYTFEKGRLKERPSIQDLMPNQVVNPTPEPARKQRQEYIPSNYVQVKCE